MDQFNTLNFSNSSYNNHQIPGDNNSNCTMNSIKIYPNQRTEATIFPIIQNPSMNCESMPINVVEPIISIPSNPETMIDKISPTFKSDDMPSLTQYPGPHNFSISVPNGEYDRSTRKGQSHVFQTTDDGMHHLFAKPEPNYWQLHYSVSDPETLSASSSSSVFIRLVPVFGDPEKAQCVMEQCPRHRVKNQRDPGSVANTSDKDWAWRSRSVVLIEKSAARYVQDPVTKRVCVQLPFEIPAKGLQHAELNCQFACYNSCFNQDSGGRKALYLIATLERINDSCGVSPEVLGRQCMQFRSCACPSRDWRDKKQNANDSGSSKMTSKSKRAILQQQQQQQSYNLDSNLAINMGGKDTIVRVLPFLPGLNEAIDAMISGFLCNRACNQGNSLESIFELLQQLKEYENRIIDTVTFKADSNSDGDIHLSSPHPVTSSPESSRISPLNPDIFQTSQFSGSTNQFNAQFGLEHRVNAPAGYSTSVTAVSPASHFMGHFPVTNYSMHPEVNQNLIQNPHQYLMKTDGYSNSYGTVKTFDESERRGYRQ